VRVFGAEPRSLITFFGTWEARATGKQKLTWWGDNAPYHVYHIPYFNSLFPACKVIFMVRDLRDVCASCKSSFGWSILKTIGVWENAMMEALMAARSCLGDSRFYQVKYEELVIEPTRELQEICRSLGVEYTNAMLSFHKFPPAKALSKLNHHRNVVEPVFSRSVGRYSRALTKEKIDTITAKLYSPMRCLDYLSEDEYAHISQSELTKKAHVQGTFR